MKSTKYIISGLTFAALASSMTFAQILDPSITGGGQETLVSGEVTTANTTTTTTPAKTTVTTPVLNSASDNMSGEININIPYNPAENDVTEPYFNSAPPEQQYTLNSATNVATGPELNMAIALILSLALSGIIYTRAKPFMK